MFRNIVQRISGMMSGLRQRFQKSPQNTTRQVASTKIARAKAASAKAASANGHKPARRPKRKRQRRVVKKE